MCNKSYNLFFSVYSTSLMKQETRKEEILRVAAKLFKEKGYSAISMRDLAGAMGMRAASLYNHINSKQDILKEIIISIAEQFTEGMHSILNSDTSNIDKLKQIIELHVNISSHNADGMASLNNDWMHLEDQLGYYMDLRHNYEDNFRAILKKGIENNEIRAAKPEIMLFSMLSTLRSLYLWIPKKEDLNPEELSSSLNEILINGIVK